MQFVFFFFGSDISDEVVVGGWPQPITFRKQSAVGTQLLRLKSQILIEINKNANDRAWFTYNGIAVERRNKGTIY